MDSQSVPEVFATPRAGILPDDEVGSPARGCVYALVVPVGGILAVYGGLSLLIDILGALGLLGR